MNATTIINEQKSKGLKGSVRTILIERKQMYDNITSCLYDMLVDNEFEMGTLEVLLSIKSPDTMRRAFKDGYTVFLMGEKMQEIEKFDAAKIPYVIVVIDKDTIFTSISSSEISY